MNLSNHIQDQNYTILSIVLEHIVHMRSLLVGKTQFQSVYFGGKY